MSDEPAMSDEPIKILVNQRIDCRWNPEPHEHEVLPSTWGGIKVQTCPFMPSQLLEFVPPPVVQQQQR